jgi:HK97 family phage major capsid protein
MAKTINETLAEHKAAAKAIVDKATAEGRDMTEAEMKAFDEAIAEYDKAKDRYEKAAAVTAKLESLGPIDLGEADDDVEVKAATLGERFTKGAGYQDLQQMAKDLGGLGRNANINIRPTRVGSLKEFMAARKGAALTTDLSHAQNIRLPMIDQVDRPALTLLDLISRGTTRGAFEYLQILAITRNTAIVPENTGDDVTDTIKPESSFTTALADAKVYDYADGYTVTNQLLQDDQALASFLNSEFRYSFDTILADKLLNGSGTNGEPKGLLNTTGVQAKSWTAGTKEALSLIEAIRQSKTLLKRASNRSVLISPEDAEKIDLLRDGNDRFYGNGPFSMGPNTLWGMPVVESEQLSAGQTIVGDFRQIALLDRSGLSVQAFNQHKDYAARNLTYVRAELRAAQAIWRPAHFVVLEKSAA